MTSGINQRLGEQTEYKNEEQRLEPPLQDKVQRFIPWWFSISLILFNDKFDKVIREDTSPEKRQYSFAYELFPCFGRSHMETGYHVHRLDPLINQHMFKVSKKYPASNLFRGVFNSARCFDSFHKIWFLWNFLLLWWPNRRAAGICQFFLELMFFVCFVFSSLPAIHLPFPPSLVFNLSTETNKSWSKGRA